MSNPNPLFKSIRKSSGIRLAVLFGSFFILLICSSVISAGISKLPFGDERTHALCSSVVQCILAFCIPSIALAKFSSNDWKGWLKLSKAPSLKSIFGVILVYIISLPAMEWLIAWNSNLHLPESMSALEQTLRNWEEANTAAANLLLNAQGFFPVFFGVLIIGVLTGFSEELFFRGGLQGIFTRSSIGLATSVWLAAFVFSAMHFQFFGFFPRLLMGVFFGYLLVWTKSIWVPVFAHILNNSVVVITSAFNEDLSQNILDGPNTSIYFENPFIVIGSGIITVLFVLLCKDVFFKYKNKAPSTLYI